MSTPVLTRTPAPVPASLPLDGVASYKLDALLASNSGSDVDLTCATGGTPTQAGAVAGPFPVNGLCAKRLYVETGGTVVFVGPTGVQDTWTVPNSFVMHVQVAYVVESGTSATGIHAII